MTKNLTLKTFSFIITNKQKKNVFIIKQLFVRPLMCMYMYVFIYLRNNLFIMFNVSKLLNKMIYFSQVKLL